MAQEWTIERVVFAPAKAAEILNAAERQAAAFNRRLNDLLEANNRYLNEARAARDEIRALEKMLAAIRTQLKVMH
jgi:hypothetical protein